MESDGENSRENHGKHPPWKPGQSGNPLGKPKGARNKLGEAFIEALHEDFQAHGVSVIEAVRTDRPHEYLKVVASLLPKQIEIKDSPFDGVSDEQLSALIMAARSALGLADQSEERIQSSQGPQSVN